MRLARGITLKKACRRVVHSLSDRLRQTSVLDCKAQRQRAGSLPSQTFPPGKRRLMQVKTEDAISFLDRVLLRNRLYLATKDDDIEVRERLRGQPNFR